MGLPAGWVTEVPGLNRNAQLKALGNGVVPQQAAAALAHMLGLDRLPALGPDPYAIPAGLDDGPEHLLPTPNPFHANNTEQPDDWRKRRADVYARTGTRHGPALSVIALSVEQGDPLTSDRYMPEDGS